MKKDIKKKKYLKKEYHKNLISNLTIHMIFMEWAKKLSFLLLFKILKSYLFQHYLKILFENGILCNSNISNRYKLFPCKKLSCTHWLVILAKILLTWNLEECTIWKSQVHKTYSSNNKISHITLVFLRQVLNF